MKVHPTTVRAGKLERDRPASLEPGEVPKFPVEGGGGCAKLGLQFGRYSLLGSKLHFLGLF